MKLPQNDNCRDYKFWSRMARHATAMARLYEGDKRRDIMAAARNDARKARRILERMNQ